MAVTRLRSPGTRAVGGVPGVVKATSTPFLGDSLTTPQSSGVSTSALQSRHFCFNVAVICFCHSTASAVLSLGILHCKITYNCCLLFFSKSLATTHTPGFFHSEPSFFHSAHGRSCRSGRAEPVKSRVLSNLEPHCPEL